MRILIATYWPVPHIGGVSTYIDTLKAGLEAVGHEVEVLGQHPELSGYHLRESGQAVEKRLLTTATEAAVTQGYKEHGVDITRWIAWREIEKATFGEMCKRLGLDQYDLIHTQDIVSTYAVANVKPNGTPLVATIHGCLATEWVESGEMQFRTNIEKEYIALEEYYGSMVADFLILPSRWLVNRLSAFSVVHPRMRVIGYGLGAAWYGPQGRKQRVGAPPGNKKVIVCVARLVAIKGHRYLVEALELLRQRDDAFVCRFVGDGVLRAELEDQVDRLGLQDYVEFLGDIPDAGAVMAAADIAVLPSLQDNLPFAVMEAQALGIPVVGTAVGGIVEMIEDGTNGFLVPPRDATRLFERLLVLLQDDNLRERQGLQASRTAATRWDAHGMLARTLQVYGDALQASCENDARVTDASCATVIPSQAFAGELNRRCRTFTAGGNDHAPVLTTVSGRVRAAATRRVVADAPVHLLDVTGVALRSVFTDVRGAYAIENVPEGTYALRCGSRAHGGRTRQIRVPQSADSSFDLLIT